MSYNSDLSVHSTKLYPGGRVPMGQVGTVLTTSERVKIVQGLHSGQRGRNHCYGTCVMSGTSSGERRRVSV